MLLIFHVVNSWPFNFWKRKQQGTIIRNMSAFLLVNEHTNTQVVKKKKRHNVTPTSSTKSIISGSDTSSHYRKKVFDINSNRYVDTTSSFEISVDDIEEERNDLSHPSIRGHQIVKNKKPFFPLEEYIILRHTYFDQIKNNNNNSFACNNIQTLLLSNQFWNNVYQEMKDDSLQSTFDYFPLLPNRAVLAQFYQTVINKILEENNIEADYEDYKMQHNHLYSSHYKLSVQEKLADTMIINLKIFLRGEADSTFQQWRRFLRFLILGFLQTPEPFSSSLKTIQSTGPKKPKKISFFKKLIGSKHWKLFKAFCMYRLIEWVSSRSLRVPDTSSCFNIILSSN